MPRMTSRGFARSGSFHASPLHAVMVLACAGLLACGAAGDDGGSETGGSSGADASSSGGNTASGGAVGTGGRSTPEGSGGGSASGGSSGSGGATGSGGSPASGGSPGSGGSAASGGGTGAGGARAPGGSSGAGGRGGGRGGAPASGSGGMNGMAGGPGSGGMKPGSGGSPGQGGAGGVAAAFANCPMTGHVTYTLTRSAQPTAAESAAYDKIVPAMDMAVAYYNCFTGITKADTVTYNASVATADGNVNGSIRFGSTDSMNYITAMHEISHTVGIGSSQFDTLVVDGIFTGTNATSQLRAITGNATDQLHADTQHFWPNGLNYTTEVTSVPRDLINHCLMVIAIRKDLGMSP